MGAVDDYFASLDDDARAAYARVRDLALVEAPDAEQGINYGMAALRHRGRPLLGFRAARTHLAVFPFSPTAVDAVRAALPADSTSKGTLRFTVEEPLPDDVVRGLVRARVAEIEASH